MIHENNLTPPPTGAQATVPGLEILGVIASGGQGTVYRAKDHQHERLVALKVLHAAATTSDTTRQTFDRERIALGRMSDHPAIVSLFDSGYTEDGAPYLVLEHVTGGSLEERLASGPLGFDEASAIIIAVAAAVERAHNNGIIHRDIKPGNVLRSTYGTWMLADFGIASLIERAPSEGSIYATYAHTAPDTFTKTPVSEASDVYSLASVLATCLTGHEPFAKAPEEPATAVILRIANQRYPSVSGDGIPDELSNLLAMALSKDPSQRPLSARAFAVALNEIRKQAGLAPVALRIGDETSPDATYRMNEADLHAAAALLNSTDANSTAQRRRGRRVAGLMAVVFLVVSLLGLSQLASSQAEIALDAPVAAAPANPVNGFGLFDSQDNDDPPDAVDDDAALDGDEDDAAAADAAPTDDAAGNPAVDDAAPTDDAANNAAGNPAVDDAAGNVAVDDAAGNAVADNPAAGNLVVDNPPADNNGDDGANDGGNANNDGGAGGPGGGGGGNGDGDGNANINNGPNANNDGGAAGGPGGNGPGGNDGGGGAGGPGGGNGGGAGGPGGGNGGGAGGPGGGGNGGGGGGNGGGGNGGGN